MATYTYAGSFPSSPALNETMDMNGVIYTYTSLGTWAMATGSSAGGYDDSTIQAEVDLNTAKVGVPTDSGSTDGDVLTTDGSGTLTWETASGGGNMELISSDVLTSSATSIEVTGITGYTRYQLHMSYIRTVLDSFPKLYLGTSSGYASSYYRNSSSSQTSIQGGQSAENGYAIYDIANLTIAAPTLLMQKVVVRSISNNSVSGIVENTFAETNSTVFDRIKVETSFSFVAGTTFTLYGFKD